MEFLFLYAIGIMLGFLLGLIVAKALFKNSIGSLVVDNSDLDGPYLFLELNDNDWYKELANNDTVSLKVVFKDYISHK